MAMRTLNFIGLSKAYAGTPALSEVTLCLQAGRVHALMGENGAGKSTLIKLIAGVTPADSIQVEKDGQPVPAGSPQKAHDAGFRFIHQELNIVEQVSVAENILLGRTYPRRFGVAVNWRQLHAQARAALDRLGATHISVTTPAARLNNGDRMLVRIAAALVTDATETAACLYVFDEPTAALTDEESEMLFAVIERLKGQGAAILYVSHRIDEVMRICDDVTVLRDGRHVLTSPIAETSKAQLIQAMTGRDVQDVYPARTTPVGRRIIASARNVGSTHLSDISFELHAGEILGVSGLAGAGQSDFLRLFLGLEKMQRGELLFDGAPAPKHPGAAWRAGISYVPGERRTEALMPDLPVRANILLPHLGEYGLKASRRAETRDAALLGDKVGLKCDGLEQPVRQLSGGNQQKVVFARAIHGTPRMLLLQEPTRGVDVGAKQDIYQLIRGLSAGGTAVILTSTDLPEILGICDRILVLHGGKQAHLLARDGLSSGTLLQTFYSSQAA